MTDRCRTTVLRTGVCGRDRHQCRMTVATETELNDLWNRLTVDERRCVWMYSSSDSESEAASMGRT